MSDFIIALADLFEAEGRVLRRATVRTVAATGLISGALILALGGVLLCLWAGYRYLETLVSPMLAALLLGLSLLVVAGVLAWLAKRMVR